MASESIEPKEEFHLFGGKESPLHPHHKAEFQVDGVKYNFVEQYVLHKKAVMCKSSKDAAELMKITDPNYLKQFEKKFIVADAKLWETKHKEFMKKGYLEKSRQVKALFDLLHDTKGKNLAYATRKDPILGIGVDANDPLSRRKSNWKGKNLLGEWLMEVREELPNPLECSFDDVASKQEATDGSPQHKVTVKEKDSNDGPEKFTFFWRTESPFSQWHPCSFVIDDQWYNCAEQYMMHQKAVTFGDHQTAQKILKEKDPPDQKRLGRKVANFDENKWSPVSMDIVKRGNLAKFGQNEKLKGLLFETAGTTLVEASPADAIWGIGLAAEDPRANDRNEWLGKNQLGQVLTEVREELMRQENKKETAKEKESVGPEMFTFFWQKESPFSQWHPCSFVIDDQRYNCAEQYMMHQKAVTFSDHQSAQQILMLEDPQEQKRLGKKVTNLDSKKWGSISMDVVKKGNLAKFGQNENLKRLLFETAGTTLVEASPLDPKWGIGLEAEDPKAKDRKQWLGKNQLGQVLTEVREELMHQEKGKVPSKDGERSLGVREKDDAGKPGKRKAGDINQGQERKSMEGVTDAKVPKGKDPTALRKEMDQRKGDSQGGKNKTGQTQRQNSSQRKDRKAKDENNVVEMRPDEMSSAESDRTQDVVESSSLSRSHTEAPMPVERMECSDVNLHGGNEETEEAGDPAWEGFNAMELDIEEDVKEKKKRERSKGDYQKRSDKERTLKKGKTGYNSRPEEEKPDARSKFDDQASTEKFTFFWRADSPFSQHHPANFIIDGVQYNCAEQFMMHQKAVVFKDEKIGWEIMHTNSPAKQKSLAKQVEGFNEAYWKTLRRNVVKAGNIAKFSQNPRLRRMLFATAGTTMVEASPVDYTWGIGLSADDPKAWRRQTWAGGNLLGEIITEVREELMEKYKNIREDEEGRMSCKDISQGNTSGYDSQYTVFWRPVSPFHPRYPVGFELDNQYYQTLQQYLLHQKALFSNDSASARAIMENFRPNKLDELGRKIRNCDHGLWSRYCRSYLRLGNFAKFSQNPNIGQQLIDNVLNGELVFAVEEDRLLGVGLKEEDGRLYRKESWKGKNLLGQALMEVRDMLMKNEQTLPKIIEELEDEDTVEEVPEVPESRVQFFFNDPPFSQWRPCRFSIGNVQYSSVEQYMIHQMALHFHDQKAAEIVMRCRNPRDMQTIDIRNYNQRDWEEACKEIVMEGNRAKFAQDRKACEDLLKTEDAILAYASVKDTVLGIGLRDTDPRAFDEQNWPGYNILGYVLMEIREELKKQTNNSNNHSNKMWQSDSKESQPDEKFTYFWQRSPFSQWWMCEIEVEGTVYNCSEQYMMHQKALYFNDPHTANEIMTTARPLDQLKLGRRIRGYSSDKWNTVCQDVVKTGNMAKFSQHPRMRQQLFDTAGTTLVEASPKDCKWGIGVTKDDPRARRRDTWLGNNLLGQILTEVRDELMKHENSDAQTYSASNMPGSGSGRDRRGSERSDGSQGHRKNSESDSRGFSHESHQKPRFDHGGAAGKPNQHHDRYDRRNQWTRQSSRPERGDTAGRPNQRRQEGNDWSQQNSRTFHGERPHVAESRPYRDGDRQRQQHMDSSSSDQHRNTEKQRQVESIPIRHSERHVSKKSHSTTSGQAQRPATRDLHSVPAERSVAAITHSGTTQGFPSSDSNTDSKVVADGAVSNENIHIISEKSALSLWHQANFEVDKIKYKSVGQYIAHQKALRFNDGSTADDIMKAQSVTRIIKCDKYVDGFDEKKWKRIHRDVVKDGNYYKFSQNEDLKQELLATSGSLLVYADVKESKLGVGVRSDDKGIRDRKRWKGENILGFVLTEVREDLIHGRDSSKISREQGSVAEANNSAVTEITEEDKRKDVQEQTLDRDVKAVASEDTISLDTGNLGATNSSCPPNKGELEKDAEAVATAPSAECKKDKVNKAQKPECLQETAIPEKENIQDSAVSDKETAIPEKENLQDSAVPEKETAVPEKESLKETDVLGKEDVQETAVPVKESLQEKENLQGTVIPKAVSEESTPKPLFSTDNNYSESHQTASNDKEASDTAATSETQVTSQNEAYDEQKYEDTQTAEPQALATNKIFGHQKDESAAEPGAGKQVKTDEFSKDSANGESHPDDAVSIATERKVLEAEATTANTCQVTSVKEVLEERNTNETSDSTKEDLADKIVNEIHEEEAISTASKTEALQVQGGIEDTVQQASTAVKADDDSNTESQPEEAISAASTENISHEKTSLKEELDKKVSAEGCQEAALAVEKETLEAEAENAGQETSMTPVDKSASGAEINKEEDVSIAEREVLEAQSNNANQIEVKTVEEELEDRSGLESDEECVSTTAETEERLESQISSADTHPVDVELTGKSEIKLTAESITEKPDDDNSSSEFKQEENCRTLQEMKSVKGLGAKSHTEHNQMQATPADTVKEILKDKASAENSCQEIKPVTEELDDKKEEKLEDKSSVESIPGEASVPVAMKEILEVEASSTETSCHETKLVKDELDDKTEAQLGDKSSVESIPEETSLPAALKEDFVTQTSPEKPSQEMTSVKEELVGKVEVALDDKSSIESYEAEADSMVADKEVLASVADAERTCPVISTKEEIDRTNISTKAEASQEMIVTSQQVTDVFATKENPPVLTDLQTGKRNAETEENCDQKTSPMDGRDKTQPETNHSHQVSSHS